MISSFFQQLLLEIHKTWATVLSEYKMYDTLERMLEWYL